MLENEFLEDVTVQSTIYEECPLCSRKFFQGRLKLHLKGCKGVILTKPTLQRKIYRFHLNQCSKDTQSNSNEKQDENNFNYVIINSKFSQVSKSEFHSRGHNIDKVKRKNGQKEKINIFKAIDKYRQLVRSSINEVEQEDEKSEIFEQIEAQTVKLPKIENSHLHKQIYSSQYDIQKLEECECCHRRFEKRLLMSHSQKCMIFQRRVNQISECCNCGRQIGRFDNFCGACGCSRT